MEWNLNSSLHSQFNSMINDLSPRFVLNKRFNIDLACQICKLKFHYSKFGEMWLSTSAYYCMRPILYTQQEKVFEDRISFNCKLIVCREWFIRERFLLKQWMRKYARIKSALLMRYEKICCLINNTNID